MGLLNDKWNDATARVAGWSNPRIGSVRDLQAEPRNSQPDAGGPTAQAVAADARTGLVPRLLAVMLMITAVLMLTFVAATGVVRGFSKQPTRLTQAMVEQQAAAEYRKARVRCQRMSSTARDACVAEAHAAEERARAVAMVAQQREDYVSKLRSRTDEMIDAGDRDSIVVEPACNIVARGQGSLCEIQMKPNSVGTNLIPATVTAAQYAALHPLKPAARIVQVRSDEDGQRSARVPDRRPSNNAQPANDRFFELAWSARQ